MNSEECCGQPEDCTKGEVSPDCLVKAVEDALLVAKQCKDKGGCGGREAALVVTELEYAMFRSYQYKSESEQASTCS